MEWFITTSSCKASENWIYLSIIYGTLQLSDDTLVSHTLRHHKNGIAGRITLYLPALNDIDSLDTIANLRRPTTSELNEILWDI